MGDTLIMNKDTINLGSKNYIKDSETSEYIRYNPLLDIRINYLKKQLKQARLVRLSATCVFFISIVVNLIKGNYYRMIVSFLYMILILILSAKYIRSLSDDLKHEQSKIIKFKVVK